MTSLSVKTHVRRFHTSSAFTELYFIHRGTADTATVPCRPSVRSLFIIHLTSDGHMNGSGICVQLQDQQPGGSSSRLHIRKVTRVVAGNRKLYCQNNSIKENLRISPPSSRVFTRQFSSHSVIQFTKQQTETNQKNLNQKQIYYCNA